MNTRDSCSITHDVVVECPLCDGPATVDGAVKRLDCSACAVRFEMAPDPPRALPAAG